MIQIALRQVDPSAVYDGKVYTQRTVAEVGSETEITINHPGTKFSEEDLGLTFVLEVYGQSVQEIGENNRERTDIALSEGGSVNI